MVRTYMVAVALAYEFNLPHYFLVADTNENESSGLAGRRVLLSGSASRTIGATAIKYGHHLVEPLVKGILDRCGGLVVGAGKEPRQNGETDSPSLLFDWTALEAAAQFFKKPSFVPPDVPTPLLVAVTSEKAEREIPPDRRQLWMELRNSGYVEVRYIQPGARSGAMIRETQARYADILVALGGGTGVEHLAELFFERRAPVIAFDLALGASREDGSGGGAALARICRTDTKPFFCLRTEYQPTAGAAYSLMSTEQGKRNVEAVVAATLALMDKLERPVVFYTRLMNPEIESHSRVEWFFRKVVDPVVTGIGYRPHEVGRDKLTEPFINLAIFENLHYSAIAVVDLTGDRNNCYMELGYAFGRGIKVLMTAEKGTGLPFDPGAIPCFFWEQTKDAKAQQHRFREFWQTNIDRGPLVSGRAST